MAKALVPVSTIATDVCIHEIGDSTEKYHMAITKWMADAFKEMHLFMSPIISIKTVCFPCEHSIKMRRDFVYETKVGIRKICKEGRKPNPIAVLWRDYDALNSASSPRSSDREVIWSIIDGTIIPDETMSFYNYNGTNVLEGYGTGVNPKGFYTLNEEEGVIHIGSMVPPGCEIVVEYKSDGLSSGFDLVPTEMVRALKDYALWKFYYRKNDRRYRQSQDDYYTQYYMVKDLYTFRPIDYMGRIFQNTPRQTINDLM